MLTAKHHDGFCLFDSKLTGLEIDEHAVRSSDIVREFSMHSAPRASASASITGCSTGTTRITRGSATASNLMRNNEAYCDRPYSFDNYLEYMHGQVRELCTEYGKLDLMWFDFSYDDMTGEKWRHPEPVRMVRASYSRISLDNRLEVSGSGGFGLIATDEPLGVQRRPRQPEQIIPQTGFKDSCGPRHLLGGLHHDERQLGLLREGQNFKPAEMIVKKLVECGVRTAICFLNVEVLDVRGNILAESVEILREIGRWIWEEFLNRSTVAAAATCRSLENGRITRSGKTLYYHIMEN